MTELAPLNWRQLRVRAVAARSAGLVPYPGLVRQINDRTCAHACLAMVTGLPIQDVIWALGDHVGLSDDQTFGFLGLCGITARHMGPDRGPHRGPVYLGTVPSLNQEFRMHLVVLYGREKHWVLRDPNAGRKGKRLMTVRRWLGNRPTIFELVELTEPTFWTPNDPIRCPEATC